MVVNGSHIFVGSNRRLGRQAIARALTRTAEVGLALRLRAASTPGQVVVEYELSPLPARNQLHLALVERGIEREIRAGENAGRHVRHDNVVRSFLTVNLGAETSSTIVLPVPEGVVRQQATVIGYVQEVDTWRILGAARADLR